MARGYKLICSSFGGVSTSYLRSRYSRHENGCLPNLKYWATNMLKKNLLAFFFLCLPLTSCLYAQGTNNSPWAGMPLPPSNQGAVIVLNGWKKSKNRNICAPLVFASTGRVLGAPISGKEPNNEWGIIYELPNASGYFGLAGRGLEKFDPPIEQWPYKVFFNDGSAVGYGLADMANNVWRPYYKNNPNGVGEMSMAGIYIPQQGSGCYYMVMTKFGRDHLESLISQLRWLKTN